jgi:putative transcriptional regulator
VSDADETAGGSVAGGESLLGKLLVAEPLLGDPNFDRSVVLILDHGDHGALGIVLNRPTQLEVAAVLDEWAGWAIEPRVLHLGGPVEQSSVIGLARRRDGEAPAGWSQIMGDVGSVDLDGTAADIGPSVDGVRFFAGYSGWGPGQLESELEDNAWLVVEATPADDVFAPDPETMWRTVLRRQGGKLGMLADFPEDPSNN